MRTSAKALAYQPLISIVMPVYNPPEAFLRAAIESVLAQVYPHWQLCIADDASTDTQIQAILSEYVIQDLRIKVIYRSENGHISAASNSALALAEGVFLKKSTDLMHGLLASTRGVVGCEAIARLTLVEVAAIDHMLHCRKKDVCKVWMVVRWFFVVFVFEEHCAMVLF
jgi:glycosyltransferase involved in cell wall biosynthesis